MIQPNSEKRALARFIGNTLGPVRVRSPVTDSVFRVGVRDYSIEGAAFLSDHAISVGTKLVVEAGPDGRLIAKPFLAEVRHATEIRDDGWLLGCRFSRYLTINDLDVLG